MECGGLGESVCAAIMSEGSISHIPKDGLHFGELECLPHSRDTDPGRIRVTCNMKWVKLRACTWHVNVCASECAVQVRVSVHMFVLWWLYGRGVELYR